MTSEDNLLRESLRAYRRRQVEPHWEALDTIDAPQYERLWAALGELGVTSFGLHESLGGLELDHASLFAIMSELGAASPSLAAGLVSHAVAQTLVSEAALQSQAALPVNVTKALQDKRFALLSSPLDREPQTSFELHEHAGPGKAQLVVCGEQRVMWPHPQWLVVPARRGDALCMCVLAADAAGIELSTTASSHGLAMLAFGTLTLDNVVVAPEQVFSWPSAGKHAALADGLVTALLSGSVDELADRSMAYALERYQGGKMIHEHDAVQQLVGPIELSRRVLYSLAFAAFARSEPADGGASAFAVESARQSALDAIQTFGGYGYTQDYRVERYLRDVNTLETFWIHAAARRRAIARERFARMAS